VAVDGGLVGLSVGVAVDEPAGADVGFQAHTGRTPWLPAPTGLGLKLKPSAEPM
jgi:hypothetical protein